MPNFSPLLGINSPILGKSNSLITPSRLYRKSQIPAVQIDQIALLDLPVPLIQTSKLFAKAAVDRLHHSTKQSEIGWDNWQPIDRSSNRDDFDYKVDRSRFNLDDRSSQIDTVESSGLDFFTTVLSAEFAEIDPQLDSLTTHPVEFEIPTSVKQDRFARVEATQTQSLEKIQPKSIEADRKLSDSNQINKIEQPKSLIKASQVSTNIQPPSTPQLSPKPVSESKIVTESSIALSLDNLALNAVDNSFLEPLLETSTDLNLNSTELPAPDLTQISRFADEIVPNLASPPELIPDFIVPNPLDAPTIINPAITPQVTPLEPGTTISIIPESAALSPEILAPFPVLEQIATATEIDPNPESSSRLLSDPSVPNPLNSPTITEITPNPESSGRLRSDLIVLNPPPTVVDLQPPALTTAQPPPLGIDQRSTAAKNVPSVMPLAVEPVREIPSLNRSESPTIENQSNTDRSEINTSLDESVIASPVIRELSSTLLSNPVFTALPQSVDPAQINTVPDRISPEIQFLQPLSPTTAQLNLAADRSNIDRDLDPSPQLESANPNIPEPLITLPTDALPTDLLATLNPEQIATSHTRIEIETDLQSTQLLNADTFQFNSLDAINVTQVSPALERISTFVDEPKSENQKSLPISTTQSAETLSDLSLSLAEPPPWRIDPDLTIESIPTLSLDFPQSNVDQSLLLSTPIASAEIIEVAKENSTASSEEFRSGNLAINVITNHSTINQTIADLSQNTSQIAHPSVDIIDESKGIANPINNLINSSNNAIQLDPVPTELPEINQAELLPRSIDSLIEISINIAANNPDITIPAPTVGYATGGYVKDANHIDLQSIATSDTVSAMLTPGEFVINAKAAQKNLDLLTHINSGGEPAATLLSTAIQPSIIAPIPTSTDISPTSIQRKRNDSLISPSLQREISLQQLPPLINPGLDPAQSSQSEGSKSSPTYSSPSMIFRKPMSSTTQPQYSGADTPDEWESIEDLMNGGNHNSDVFSMKNSPQQHPDLESQSSPKISPQYASQTRGFADGGEVTPSDISTKIEPITYTIESPTNSQKQEQNNDPAELEILAREIYHRLRQRLEIERERHGSYSGNLAW
jgi:hypothetical protein